jgi:hypothetical protein
MPCFTLELVRDADGWLLECYDGGGPRPIVEWDPGDDDSQPDLDDGTVAVSPDPGTPGVSFTCGNAPVDTDDVVSVFVPAVDAAGEPTCDVPLPVCVTLEGRLDFERPLLWTDNCTDAAGAPGVVLNGPGAVGCTVGSTSYAGGVACTMVPRDVLDPAQGCLYRLSASPGSCAITGRTMHPEQRPPHLVGRPTLSLCSTGDVELENIVAVTDAPGATAAHLAVAGNLSLRNRTVVDGDVLVGGDLSMRNQSLITGEAQVAGAADVEPPAQVSGGVSSATWPGDICTCGTSLVEVMDRAALWNDNARILADPVTAALIAGGALDIEDGEQLTLGSGDYYFTAVRLRTGAELRVAAGAHVRIYVAGPIELESGATVVVPPLVSRLDVTTDHVGPHHLVNRTDATLYLYAPAGFVNLRNSAELRGAITCAGALLENGGLLIREVGASEVSPDVAPTCQWSP